VAPRAGGNPSGRAALGSVAPRKMACPLAARGGMAIAGSRPSTRVQEGAARSLPLSIGTEMDAKTTHVLVLLAALSLVCTALASVVDHAVFSSVFAALAAVAVLGITPRERN
jgi:hypothetical protein